MPVWKTGEREAIMESTTMGRVVVAAVIENLHDLYELSQGQRTAEQVRRVEVTDALVDTGATGLLLPKRLVQQLGLQPLHVRQARTIAGPANLPVFRAVRLTIQNRDCISDVGEIADECPVIIGQVPLELLDWVVDPKRQQLIGNPEHGGQHMVDVF